LGCLFNGSLNGTCGDASQDDGFAFRFNRAYAALLERIGVAGFFVLGFIYFKLVAVIACLLSLLSPCYRPVCRRCWRPLLKCCRLWKEEEPEKPVPVVHLGDEVIPLEHLRRKKEASTAYMLLYAGGTLGLHHFYLERLVHGFICVLSLNFLGFGWFVDGLLIPAYVRWSNGGVAPVAATDGAKERLRGRMPVLSGAWALLVLVALAQGPRLLRVASVVDLERVAARTSRNPFVVLGADRDIGPRAARAAYRDQMAILQVLRRCNGTCRAKKRNLAKAYEFVSGRSWRGTFNLTGASANASVYRMPRQRAPRGVPIEEVNRTRREVWADWTDFVAFQWVAVGKRGQRRLERLAAQVEDWIEEQFEKRDAAAAEGEAPGRHDEF